MTIILISLAIGLYGAALLHLGHKMGKVEGALEANIQAINQSLERCLEKMSEIKEVTTQETHTGPREVLDSPAIKLSDNIEKCLDSSKYDDRTCIRVKIIK